jgi:hypothetical protein
MAENGKKNEFLVFFLRQKTKKIALFCKKIEKNGTTYIIKGISLFSQMCIRARFCIKPHPSAGGSR